MCNNNDRQPGIHRRNAIEYKGPVSSENIKAVFSQCADFIIRPVDVGLSHKLGLSLCLLDGVSAGGAIAEELIKPLTQEERFRGLDARQCFTELLTGGVYSCSLRECRDMDTLVGCICAGYCAVIFDTLAAAVCFELKSDKTRSIAEPTLEKSIKGAKDSFVEQLRVNTALVRRRLQSPRLHSIETTVGRKSMTKVSLMYYDGIANPDTVALALKRLDEIDIDTVLSVGDIEQRIVDAPRSPFPQLIHTERPDRMAMYISDGRIGLIIDGLPVALVLPVSFPEFLKVVGDSSMHPMAAVVLTVLRYLSLILTLLLPAFYVAVAMYHQEMIPTKLLMSIVEAKRDVPFSTALEIISMLAAFAMLQEAGLRLPDPVGNTVSIIGALIVGQSAVEAKLVSPITIIVVAVSGIACYTLPSQDLGSALRLSRLFLLAAAIFAGLFGVGLGCCLLLLHLSSIDSFDVPYTGGFSGAFKTGKRKFRDPLLKTPDRRREK